MFNTHGIDGNRSSAGRRCIFCGRTPVTSEHVIGDWFGRFAREHFPEFSNAAPAWYDDHAEDVAHDRRIEFRALPASQTARVACERCNSGWMSRLETRAADVLRPLLEGQVQTLQPDDQREVAAWSLKTTYVIQATKPEGVTDMPRERTSHLAEHATPPAGTAVWISSWSGPRLIWHAYWRMRGAVPPEPLPDHANLYGCTFTLGPLVFQTFGSTQAALPAEGVQIGQLARLWPSPRSLTCAAHPAAMQASELEPFAAQVPLAIEQKFNQPWMAGRFGSRR